MTTQIAELPPERLLELTEEEFRAMPSPTRLRALRRLLTLSCECSGRTAAEADAKRKPFNRKMEQLQAIHDQQWADFWYKFNMKQLQEV